MKTADRLVVPRAVAPGVRRLREGLKIARGTLSSSIICYKNTSSCILVSMARREFPSGCDSGTVLRLARSRSGTALTLRQLQYWDRTGLLSARTRQARGKRFYSFEDVLRLRVIVHLLESRLPTQRVRAAIENISRAAERVGRPWQTLRVVTDGNSVFVLDGDLALDALRNQLVSVVLLGDLTTQTRKVFARVAAGRHAA